MNSLFDPADREALCRRFASLEPGAQRHWGRMEPAQMLRHCAIAMEDGLGARQVKQAFLGKLVTPFIRGQVFGEKPFRRSAPTDPTYVVSDPRDFEAERSRLAVLIDRLVQQGVSKTDGLVHPFFGRLSGPEWGRLVYKHLDHHLRQFGV